MIIISWCGVNKPEVEKGDILLGKTLVSFWGKLLHIDIEDAIIKAIKERNTKRHEQGNSK